MSQKQESTCVLSACKQHTKFHALLFRRVLIVVIRITAPKQLAKITRHLVIAFKRHAAIQRQRWVEAINALAKPAPVSKLCRIVTVDVIALETNAAFIKRPLNLLSAKIAAIRL